jgi:hypothetical protein
MPHFIHDSLDSVFLGSQGVGARIYDLYLHDASPEMLVARYGDGPSDILELPLQRAQGLARQGEYVPEAILAALTRLKRMKVAHQHDDGRDSDVTPKLDPVSDLAAWTEAVRAAETAASFLADAQVVGNQRRDTLALVCKDAAGAQTAYHYLEKHANELRLVAERPSTRRLVYVHYHGAR